MVNIRVRRVCEAHVTGVPERVDYTVSQHCYSIKINSNISVSFERPTRWRIYFYSQNWH
jgi:hypothetical protein